MLDVVQISNIKTEYIVVKTGEMFSLGSLKFHRAKLSQAVVLAALDDMLDHGEIASITVELRGEEDGLVIQC